MPYFMKFSQYFYLIVVVLFATSCDWLDGDNVEPSSLSSLTSLTFKNASAADVNVTKARFAIVFNSEFPKDSLIVNTDSLPYNTQIDSIIPVFSFASSTYAVAYRNDANGLPFDSVFLTGKDTLNFNRVYKIRNVASNGLSSSTYRIKINVHKVEPELFQWKRTADAIFPQNYNLHGAALLKDKIYFFGGNGLFNRFSTSGVDGRIWTAHQLVADLPGNANLDNIRTFGNHLFLLHNEMSIYKSNNGATWTRTDVSTLPFVFKSLISEFKGDLWAIVQTKNDQKLRFAKTTDGENWTQMPAVADADFPVHGFAAVAFKSRTNEPKILVAGGFNQNGIMTNQVYSSLDGQYWVNFTTQNQTYGKRSNAQIIAYENKLLMFGGVDENKNIMTDTYLQSMDEGFSWKAADTSKMVVRQVVDGVYEYYNSRHSQAVIVNNNKQIILLGGGLNKFDYKSDVWVGRLNKSIFIIN